jgi:hypothetical protein
VSKNILIVESENDKYFIEALLDYMNISDLEVQPPICVINDYKCLGGLSEPRLINKLSEIAIEIGKRGIENIGILIDADKVGIEARIALVNRAVKTLDKTININQDNQWFYSKNQKVDFSCHILNVSGYGELETLLKQIKSEKSTFSDCLEVWRHCIEDKGSSIKTKDFDKFWINIYQRYDTCTKKESKQAGKKCNFQASLNKDIWDFSHSSLNHLKDFLRMFQKD